MLKEALGRSRAIFGQQLGNYSLAPDKNEPEAQPFSSLAYCPIGEIYLGFSEFEVVVRRQGRSRDDEDKDPRCGGGGFVD
jgi:hypothetical protein